MVRVIILEDGDFPADQSAEAIRHALDKALERPTEKTDKETTSALFNPDAEASKRRNAKLKQDDAAAIGNAPHASIEKLESGSEVVVHRVKIGSVTAVESGATVGALSAATFNSDLASDVGAGQFAAHHAVLFTADSGELRGDTYLLIDENGSASYVSADELLNDDFLKKPISVKADASDTVAERWAELDRYAAENPGAPVSPLGQELFPELEIFSRARNFATPDVPPLPTEAPELWKDRKDRSESAVQFATRVYRMWMDAGVISRPDINRLDSELYAAINNWLKHNRRKPTPDPLPEGFNLLTAKQVTDAWINRVTSGREGLPSDPTALARFAMAQRYREGKDNKR